MAHLPDLFEHGQGYRAEVEVLHAAVSLDSGRSLHARLTARIFGGGRQLRHGHSSAELCVESWADGRRHSLRRRVLSVGDAEGWDADWGEGEYGV